MKVQIGKNGLTDGVLEHIKNACNTHEEITVNYLQSFTAANNIDEATKTIIAYLDPLHDVDAETRGNTATLHIQD